MTHVPLFGNAGRRAAAPPPSAPTPPSAPRERQAPGDPVSVQAERLGQQLREIAAGTVAPEEAFEPALRAILESTNCAAGAICLYDQRHEMLRLAAEVGLSDEGCKHLRSVGGGSTWDMPLHGLRNRRAYLIDSAAQNRYVPGLVEGTAQTIACIPMHSGVTPLGSLVLITVRPRVLGERDIRMIERPIRELVKMIEMIRRRGPGASAGAPPPAPAAAAPAPRPAAPAPAPAAPAVEAPPAASAPAPQPASAPEVADDGTAARLAEVEAALAVEREERTVLEARLADERRLRGEVDAALAAERQARAALEAAAADPPPPAPPDPSVIEERRALEAALAEAQRARADVGTALADAQRARAELEQALAAERSKGEAALDEARQGRAELEAGVAEERRLRAEVERALADEHAAHETALAEVRDVRAELEAAVTEERRLRAEAEAALAQERTLRQETEAARATAEQEAAAAASRARAADDQASRAQAQLMEAQAHARAVDEARAAAASSAGTASDALAQAEAETRTLRDRVADLDGQLDTLRAERDELRRSLEGSAAEQQALVASLDAVRTEQAQLQAMLEEARAGRAAPAAKPAPAAAVAPAAAPPAPAAPEPAPAPPAAAPPPAIEITGDPGVVVLDVDGQWSEIVLGGTRVVALAPGADVVERMAGTAPTAVIVNLAAPGALAGLAALRAAGVSAPAFACVAASGRALALGGMDVVARPIDTDSVVAAVLRASSGPGRLVTVSGDVEALLSVRQALTRKGTSVSMAWDSKQALDLLGMMRPDVVLVDLELGKQACAVVAALEGVEPVPSLLIVPADVDQADAFVALTRDAQRVARMVPLKGMVAVATKAAEAPRKPA